MAHVRDLLDRVAIDHRSDIKLYCSGHLNENHLWKPEEKRHLPWEFSSRTSRPPRSRPPAPCTNHPVRQKHDITTHKRRETIEPLARPKTSEGKPTQSTSISLIERPKSVTSRSDAMLNRTPNESNRESNEKGLDCDLMGDHRDIKLGVQTDFMREHLHVERVTKADQYREYRRVDSDVVESTRSHQRQALWRTRNIDAIEARLQCRLSSLGDTKQQLSYHRLQIYRSCLDDVIENCETFGFLIRRIQIEFDRHVSCLLDRLASRNQADLRRNLKSASLEPSLLEETKQAQSEVEELEGKAKELLKRNESLRLKLQHERDLSHQSAQQAVTDPAALSTSASGALASSGILSTAMQEFASKLDDLHFGILHRLEEHDRIKMLQKKMVPLFKCQQLEHCIGKADVSIQHLVKHNDMLQKEIAKTEAELEDAVEATNTSGRDKKKLWKEVNAFRVKEAAERAKLQQPS